MGNTNADNNSYSENTVSSSSTIAPLIVEAQTLVAQTQERMWKALEGNYLYDSSLKDSQTFLFNHMK